MLVYDNGKLNILAENRCGNTSMYHYFKLPVYGMMINTSRQQLRNLWKQNKSEKIVVLRDPYQRMHSAIAYHQERSLPLYNDYMQMTDEQRKKLTLFWTHKNIGTIGYENFKMQDIRGHAQPYLRHLIGNNFRYIKFSRLSQYLGDCHHGPITNTTSSDFSEEFLRYFDLDTLKFEKFLYQEYLDRFEEISPEEWENKTIRA